MPHSARATAGSKAKPLLVTVVDDDPTLLLLVGSILERRGHHVEKFQHPDDALSGVVANVPDVLLVDLNMPGMDGATLCQALQAQLLARMPPTVMLSASDDWELLGQGMDALKSVTLLRKPFRVPELVSIVERAAGLHRGEGRVLGGWQLGEELGRGALGVVYRASPVAGGTGEAAVKLLRAEVTGEQDAQDLRRELLMLCTLHDKGIVRVHAAGVEEGVPYYVMDYINGPTLGRVLTSAWSFEKALPVLTQVSSAVTYLHDHGVIHRDLKASNILLDKGQARLVDFGTARLMSVRKAPGQGLLGTPAYMAPEMMDGETNAPSVDVFALGVLTYKVLAGRWPVEPLQRDAAHWSEAYATQGVMRLDLVAPSVPPPVGQLVSSMLSVDPAARPSALQVHQRLQEQLGA